MLSPVHKRELEGDDRRILLDRLLSAGMGEFDEADIDAAVAAFLDIESKIHGRIAGPIAEYIAIFLFAQRVAQARTESKSHVVEIGTLFGGCSLLIWRALRSAGCHMPVLTIDPLDGYYPSADAADGAEKNRDIVLDVVIDRETFLRNLQLFDVPGGEISLHQDFSQSDESVAAAKALPISFLFIDGDHSFEGIQRDLDLYLEAVEDGGLVLVDNFFDPDWPLVTEGFLANPEYLKVLEPIFCHSRLLVLRKLAGSRDLTPFTEQYRYELNLYLTELRDRMDGQRHLVARAEHALHQRKTDVENKIADVSQHMMELIDNRKEAAVETNEQLVSLAKAIGDREVPLSDRLGNLEEKILALSHSVLEQKSEVERGLTEVKQHFVELAGDKKEAVSVAEKLVILEQQFTALNKSITGQRVSERIDSVDGKIAAVDLLVGQFLRKSEVAEKNAQSTFAALQSTLSSDVASGAQARELSAKLESLLQAVDESSHLKTQVAELEARLVASERDRDENEKAMSRLRFELATFAGELQNRQAELAEIKRRGR